MDTKRKMPWSQLKISEIFVDVASFCSVLSGLIYLNTGTADDLTEVALVNNNAADSALNLYTI